jgi:hypothetical protein
MQAHGVPTARAWIFEGCADPVEAFTALDGQLVLKFDGLAAGKGVWVCDGLDEAFAALAELRARHGAKASFLVEERLAGNELSASPERRRAHRPAARLAGPKALLDATGPQRRAAWAPSPGGRRWTSDGRRSRPRSSADAPRA